MGPIRWWWMPAAAPESSSNLSHNVNKGELPLPLVLPREDYCSRISVTLAGLLSFSCNTTA